MTEKINSKIGLKYIIISIILILGSIPLVFISSIIKFSTSDGNIFYFTGLLSANYILAIVIAVAFHFIKKKRTNIFFVFSLTAMILSVLGICSFIN